MKTSTERWLHRIDELPFGWMLLFGTGIGLGLGSWLLFRVPDGSAGAGGAVGLLALGTLLAWRVRVVAAREQDAKPKRKARGGGWLRWRVPAVTSPRSSAAETEAEPGAEQPPLVDMVPIEAGEFRMGSAGDDRTGQRSERPQHRVSLSAFWIGRTPVTRGQYRELMAGDPAAVGVLERWGDGGDELPATHLNWHDAVRFCNALSRRDGYSEAYREQGGAFEPTPGADGYRLPTEAEWEYSCRAGSTTPWFWGEDPGKTGRFAWFSGNSGRKVHPVATKDPNPWGLYDTAGNVWEWCQDWYGGYRPGPVTDPTGPAEGDFRVLRGGSAWYVLVDLRSALRYRRVPGNRSLHIGFRCARPRRQP